MPERDTGRDTAAEMQPAVSSEELEREIGQVNAERARLVTDQPAGWPERYAELGVRLTELSRRWQGAREREEVTRWRENWPR